MRCNGAAADGIHDDTNAINNTIATAVANNWPMRLSAGTYKVTSQLTIDYTRKPARGFASSPTGRSSMEERLHLVRCCRSDVAVVPSVARRGASISKRKAPYSSMATAPPMSSCSVNPTSPMRTTRQKLTT
ncbi:MAG: hypothetical protein JO095_06700 [Alphaproteobacteria bacterium]|nr:hypothetical protein [Alphaproteobacteria bacterium]